MVSPAQSEHSGRSADDAVPPLQPARSSSPLNKLRRAPSGQSPSATPALDGGAPLGRALTATSSSRGVGITSIDVRGGFGRVTSRYNVEGEAANNLVPAAEAAASAEDAAEDAGKPVQRPKLDKYSYHFFSPEMKMFRGIVFKILGSTAVITILVMWLCLPLYWGSLWKSNVYTNKLTVRVIDADGGAVGSYVSSALLAETNLKYFSTSPSEFPTTADLEYDIINEGAWAAIVVNAGTTTGLEAARTSGDASWAGNGSISVYYSQARQETAINSYIVPYVEAALGAITAAYNAESVASYLSANSGNATAMALLAQAPTTVSQAIYYEMVNLRPYNQPVAQAITLVGFIYLLIFSFVVTMSNNAAREIIAPFLTTRAYIAYRLITPLVLYAAISFFYAMIDLAFKIHFGAHFTYAGGFFLWWFGLFLTMAAVGLATEFAITILGPKFISFFLVPLIIANVSVASLPHELQPWIYRYGVAMPFYNAGRMVRTIIFNTRNEIGQNCGILLAWIAVSIITISLSTWLMRRKAVNEYWRDNVSHSDSGAEKAGH